MKKDKLRAVRNLKKSAIFAGFIGTITIGLGLGVSIPVYFKVKKSLEQVINKIVDLSKYFDQLTNKLGISPNEEFITELSGGYTMVVSKGVTEIYRKIGDDKVLILNKNANGTIGTAGSMTGPGATGILGVLKEAETTAIDNADAINDILGPIKQKIDKESLANESRATGKSEAFLKARNALSNDNAKEAQAALDKLKALDKEVAALSTKDIQEAQVSVKEEKSKQKSIKTISKEDIQKLIKEKQDKLKKEEQKRIKEEKDRLEKLRILREDLINNSFLPDIKAFYGAYTLLTNIKGKVTIHLNKLTLKTLTFNKIKQVLNFGTLNDLSTWILSEYDPNNLKTTEIENRKGFEEIQSTWNAIQDATPILLKQIAKEEKEAKELAEKKAKELAEKKENGIITTAVKKLDTYLDAYTRSFGYDQPLDTKNKKWKASKQLRNKLEQKVASVSSMSSTMIASIKQKIMDLLNINNDTQIPSNFVTYKSIYDSVKETDPTINNLIIIKADVKNYGDSLKNKSVYIFVIGGDTKILNLKAIQEFNYPDINKLKRVNSTISKYIELANNKFSQNYTKNKWDLSAKQTLKQAVTKTNPFKEISSVQSQVIETIMETAKDIFVPQNHATPKQTFVMELWNTIFGAWNSLILEHGKLLTLDSTNLTSKINTLSGYLLKADKIPIPKTGTSKATDFINNIGTIVGNATTYAFRIDLVKDMNNNKTDKTSLIDSYIIRLKNS